MTAAAYPITSPEHAVIAWAAFVAAVKAGLDATPIYDDQGNVTAAFEIAVDLPDDSRLLIDKIILVVPPPSDDDLVDATAENVLHVDELADPGP